MKNIFISVVAALITILISIIPLVFIILICGDFFNILSVESWSGAVLLSLVYLAVVSFLGNLL